MNIFRTTCYRTFSFYFRISSQDLLIKKSWFILQDAVSVLSAVRSKVQMNFKYHGTHYTQNAATDPSCNLTSALKSMKIQYTIMEMNSTTEPASSPTWRVPSGKKKHWPSISTYERNAGCEYVRLYKFAGLLTKPRTSFRQTNFCKHRKLSTNYFKLNDFNVL